MVHHALALYLGAGVLGHVLDLSQAHLEVLLSPLVGVLHLILHADLLPGVLPLVVPLLGERDPLVGSHDRIALVMITAGGPVGTLVFTNRLEALGTQETETSR